MAGSYLQAIRTQGHAANPFFQLMGITIQQLETGQAALAMPIRADMLNGEGWLQGGLFVALGDEAMALALYTVLGESEHAATVSESTSFLKGMRSGTAVATGRVAHKGHRIAFMEAEVRNGVPTGEVLARTSATFLIR